MRVKKVKKYRQVEEIVTMPVPLLDPSWIESWGIRVETNLFMTGPRDYLKRWYCWIRLKNGFILRSLAFDWDRPLLEWIKKVVGGQKHGEGRKLGEPILNPEWLDYTHFYTQPAKILFVYLVDCTVIVSPIFRLQEHALKWLKELIGTRKIDVLIGED